MADNLKESLDQIICGKHIKTVFQPIISLRDGSVLGHEALSRVTCENEIKTTDMLFNVANKYNRLWDLELLCRTTALETAIKFMMPSCKKKLFINVNPNIIHDDNFKKGFTKEILKQYQIIPNDIIFEITERNIITDMGGFMAAIDHYRSQDYKIAIDDAGSGYSGLNLISDINPNYIKLDIKLIRGVDTDSLKYALVKGMAELSKVSSIQLIAEGIETPEEMETLVNLGIQFGQGYFIQRPDPEIKAIRPEVLELLKKYNLRKNHISQNSISSIYIKNLCTATPAIPPEERIPDVYEMFRKNRESFGFCVTKNGVPLGIVTPAKLSFKLSGQYGFSLYRNKRISEVMDRDFISVDSKTPVSTVSSIAMSRGSDKLYDFIVVTENEKYLGTVTIKDLLLRTTEIEVSNAKNQNPLTGLPGNRIINEMLVQCVEGSIEYSVAYFDIETFKAYNDVYGFEKGDLVIKLLAEILKNSLSADGFVGHVGGDDFVVILKGIVTAEYFHDIKKIFEHEVLELYNAEDIKNGYITTSNRHGVVEKYSLITLTVVAVNNKSGSFKNVFEVTETLAGLKRKAKQKLQ